MQKKLDLLDYVSLALALFLMLCLCRMPYGYYIFIRYMTMVVGIAWAVRFFKEEKSSLGYLCLSVSVLFQPFVKFALGRTMWNVVDIVCAVALVVAVFCRERQKE